MCARRLQGTLGRLLGSPLRLPVLRHLIVARENQRIIEILSALRPNCSSMLLFVTLALASSLSATATATAVADAESDRALGLALAREGRCDSALEVLARVQAASPGDAEVARVRGECALRRQDLGVAIESLELARALDPSAPEVDLHLGMAYYHAGRIEEAEEALVRAGAVDGTRPEFLLYSGLVAYAQTDYAAAIRRLDAATQLSDSPVEPMASFFVGHAALGEGNRDRARASFEGVVRRFPGTPWAEEAQRALDQLEDDEGLQWWASVELGFEYDDNPLLRGTGVGLPSEIAGQSDVLGFWFVDVGATLFEVAGFKGGGMLRYGGSEHAELERFDTHAPGATIWVDRELGVGDASLRLQYDFDAALIDYQGPADEPFVLSHLVGASIFKPWEKGMYTIVGASVGYDKYGYDRQDFTSGLLDLGGVAGPLTPCIEVTVQYCTPVPLDEADATDRDGTGLSASLLHHVPLPIEVEGLTNPWIEGEYRYQRYWSDGSEYDHQRHQVEIGLGVVLPFEVGLRVSGRYAYVPYGNASVFPDPSDVVAASSPPNAVPLEYLLDNSDREEHETGLRVSLERALGQHVVLTTRYTRSRTRSTADVFSYTRDVVGVSIRVGLDGSL